MDGFDGELTVTYDGTECGGGWPVAGLGYHDVEMNASNEVSAVSVNEGYYVEETITVVTLTANGKAGLYVTPNVAVIFTVGIEKGSNVTIELATGENNITTYSDTSGTVDISFTYTDKGSYTPTVTVFNNVSSGNASCMVGVQWPITSSMTLNATNVTLDDSAVTVTVFVDAVDEPEPCDLNITVDFDDGTVTGGVTQIAAEQTTPTAVPAKTHTESHTYNAYGYYTVSVFVRNEVSNITLTILVKVGVDIEGHSIGIVGPECLDPGSSVDVQFNITGIFIVD